MFRVALKSLLAHKLRLLLSGFAIVLGVAFVAGSFVFTDTLQRSFSDIVGNTQPDVVVRPTSALSDAGVVEGSASTATLPASLVDSLRQVDGVARTDPDVSVPLSVFVLDHDKKVVGGQGAPGIATNYTGAPGPDGKPLVTLESGREPNAAAEVALDIDTASKAGYSVGDTVPMVTTGDPARLQARLVGTVRFGPDNNLVGASLLLFDTKFLQDTFFGGRDVVTSVSVTAADGVSPQTLRDRVAKQIPADAEARTGASIADEQQRQIEQGLSFINTFLLVFAFIALVVGSFLIVNTFSILVAQRVRELALLRALGAARSQVVRSVLIEALLMGLAGGTTGLLLGIGLAMLLRLLFGAIGLDLGQAPLVFLPRTAVVAYAVGILVTLIAAWLPARRASRVPPVAAMRDDVALPETSMRRRAVGGVLLLVAGAAALTAGLLGTGSGSQSLSLVGLGVLGTLLGVTLLAPLIAPGVVAVLAAGYPRLFGAVGRMARENSRRNPRRTAATAAALMLGLALVTALSVLGASTRSSVSDLVDTGLKADDVVSNAVGQPFSPTIARDMARVDGVAAVAPYRVAFGLVDGDATSISAFDPANFAGAVDLTMTKGSVTGLRSGSVLVSDQQAAAKALDVGDRVAVTLPKGKDELTIAGVYKNSQFVGTPVVMSFADLERGGIPVADTILYVSAAPGADTAAVRQGLDAVVKDLPLITVQTRDEFAGSQADQVDQLLNILYALLGLALVIAILGIVNTLALSVIERTREIGLLRAVGMGRGQLRLMVVLESVVIAVLGALLGIAMGLIFGIAVQRPLRSQGLEVLAIPWGQLIAYVVAAAVIGVLAAVWPARRAARLDVLRAITTE